MPVAAAVFDMDGVLIDSEQAWADARERLARETGGAWAAGTQERMMGMSSPERARQTPARRRATRARSRREGELSGTGARGSSRLADHDPT